MIDEQRFSVFCDECEARVGWERHAVDALDEARAADWTRRINVGVRPPVFSDYCPDCAQQGVDK